MQPRGGGASVFSIMYAAIAPTKHSRCSGSTSAVSGLRAIATKYGRYGKTVEIVGLNASSAQRHERLAGKLGGH